MPKSDKQPLYLRIIDKLKEVIAAYEPGEYLPSEPKLAKQLGVSRATLREAMRVFEGQGLVVRRQGVGTIVSKPPKVIESGIETLESIESQAKRIGLSVKMGDLRTVYREPTEEERLRFALHDGIGVVELSRVMETDSRPVAYLIDVVPQHLLPEESKSSDFRGSVLDLMLERKHPAISHALSEVHAVYASSQVARQLHIQRGDVLLCLEGWLYSKEGTIIDHTHSYFLPGTFRFHVLRRPAEI